MPVMLYNFASDKPATPYKPCTCHATIHDRERKFSEELELNIASSLHAKFRHTKKKKRGTRNNIADASRKSSQVARELVMRQTKTLPSSRPNKEKKPRRIPDLYCPLQYHLLHHCGSMFAFQQRQSKRLSSYGISSLFLPEATWRQPHQKWPQSSMSWFWHFGEKTVITNHDENLQDKAQVQHQVLRTSLQRHPSKRNSDSKLCMDEVERGPG